MTSAPQMNLAWFLSLFLQGHLSLKQYHGDSKLFTFCGAKRILHELCSHAAVLAAACEELCRYKCNSAIQQRSVAQLRPVFYHESLREPSQAAFAAFAQCCRSGFGKMPARIRCLKMLCWQMMASAALVLGVLLLGVTLARLLPHHYCEFT